MQLAADAARRRGRSGAPGTSARDERQRPASRAHLVLGEGFKQFRHAAITIAGIELMHRIRKGQFGLRRLGVRGLVAPSIWSAVLGA
jgi:hypothetical protein